MKDYVMAYLHDEMSVCQAYKCVYDELAKEEISDCRRSELREQKVNLQYHMAVQLMHKMGYVQSEQFRGDNCYPATVWDSRMIKLDYAYGTDEALAEKYASVLHDLVCTDDMIEYQRLVETSHIISSQIVSRFMEHLGYICNGSMLWVCAGNNGQRAAGERAESEEI